MALSCAYLMGNIVLYIGLERWPNRRYPRIGSTLSRDWTKSYTAGDSNARHCTRFSALRKCQLASASPASRVWTAVVCIRDVLGNTVQGFRSCPMQ